MNRLRVHLKAQIAKTLVFKRESKKILRANGGSHTIECYDYEEERKKLRSMFLVYGFRRGLPYEAMERTSRLEPDWRQFRELAFQYGVRKPRLKGWYPDAKDLKSGFPFEFQKHLKERLGADFPEPDNGYNHTEKEWLSIARQLFPEGEASDYMESYLQMEEWIQSAYEHYVSNPLYVDPVEQGRLAAAE